MPGSSDSGATICEAVLAALAAPFPATSPAIAIGSNSVALGGRALAAKVENEAMALWCSQPAELPSLVLCFVSFATKEARKRRADDAPPENLSLVPDERYFRFELDRALADDGLTDDRWLTAVRTSAEELIEGQRTAVRHCVLTLKDKRSEYIPLDNITK